jgi:hypothetical protein
MGSRLDEPIQVPIAVPLFTTLQSGPTCHAKLSTMLLKDATFIALRVTYEPSHGPVFALITTRGTGTQKIITKTCHELLSLSALRGEGSYKRCPQNRRRVMKNHRFNSILSSSLIACALTIGSFASAPQALAQSSQLAEVTIPFTFQTDHRTFAAGTYRIARESDHVVLLRGPGNSYGLILMNDAVNVHPSARGELVFDRYGDKYFLRQIWTAGTSIGLECPKSRAEKQALVAENKQAPDSTEVAFNTVPSR